MRTKIAFTVTTLLLLASPLVASADLLSDLQAQVQALLAQIAALQGQQTSPPLPPNGDDYPTPTPGNTCPNLSVTMQRGARDATMGGQVSELQIFLANRYNLNDEDVVTGYFGRTTERYVIQFQREQGLPTFGIVGSLTRAAIGRVCGGDAVPPIACPIYSPPLCRDGEILVGQGVDERGCQRPPVCRPGSTSNVTLMASPSSGVLSAAYGTPTLWVDFNVSNYTPVGGEIVDFGDGSRSALGYTTRTNSRHDYHKAGTYTVRLLGPGCDSAPGGITCTAVRQVLASTIVVVSDQVRPSSDSISIESPTGVYLPGDSIGIRWRVSGIPADALGPYAVRAELLPIDAGRDYVPVIGQDAYGANIPASSLSTTLPAPHGGWWNDSTRTKNVESRYKARVTLAIKDPSVCAGRQIFLLNIIQKFFGVSTAEATSIAPCSGYRTVAYADSAPFVIKQPRFYKNSETHNVEKKTVTVQMNILLPNSCFDYQLSWGDSEVRYPRTGEPSTVVSRPAADTGCTADSPMQSASESFTYSYHRNADVPQPIGAWVQLQTKRAGAERWEFADGQSVFVPYAGSGTLPPPPTSQSCDGYLLFSSSNRTEKQFYLYPQGQQVESAEICKAKALDGFQKYGGIEKLSRQYCDIYSTERPATVTPIAEFGKNPVQLGSPLTCSSPTTLPIIFTSPVGGETFSMGQSILVRWTNGDAQGLEFENVDTKQRTFWRDALGAGQDYTLQVPGGLTPGKYRLIGYWYAAGGQRRDVGASNAFTITSASDQLFWVHPDHASRICRYFAGVDRYDIVSRRDARCTGSRCVSPPFYWLVGSDWALAEDRPDYLPADGIVYQVRCSSTGAYPMSAPSCSIYSDKESYSYGEMITFKWTSTNANYAVFVPDTSGKDNLPVPGDKLAANGSQPISASVLGNPYVTLKVVGADGQSATCSKTVSVTQPSGPAAVSTWKKYDFSAYNGKLHCFGGRYVGYSQKYGKWVGAASCNDVTDDQYKLYMSDSETGTYYQIADTAGHGQDHCELVNPTFTIPNEDDIKSGGCATCDILNMSDPQGEPVFVRANFGQPFSFQTSVFWADLTSQIYKCGVLIPPATPQGDGAQPPAGANAGRNSQLASVLTALE
ncbi:MAG: peptidoglycan-binding protein, partial [Parcubacteria group bacterium]|nr:peptidoglycan-binding protein [Parcubacteria group bacterium]